MSLQWRYLLAPLALPALMTGLSVGLASLTARPSNPASTRPGFALASQTAVTSMTALASPAAWAPEAAWASAAILASEAKEVDSSASSRGYLGVSCQRLTRSLREVLEIPKDVQGVLISDVVDGSAADRAGLKNRDVVLAMDGKDIDDERAFTAMIRSAGADSKVHLTVWRDGKSLDLTATLGAAPAGRRDYNWSWSSDDDGDAPERAHRQLRDLKALEKLEDLQDLDVMAPPPMPPMSPRHGRGPMSVFVEQDHGRLGVQLQDMNKEIAEYFSAPGGKGALIWKVMDDSPAEKSGLKAGDVIVEVEGDRVADVDDLQEAVREHDAGDTVAVTVLRRGQSITVTATLDDGPVESGAVRIFRGRGPAAGKGFSWTPGPGADHEAGPSLERIQRQIERLQSQLDEMRQKLNKLKD